MSALVAGDSILLSGETSADGNGNDGPEMGGGGPGLIEYELVFDEPTATPYEFAVDAFVVDFGGAAMEFSLSNNAGGTLFSRGSESSFSSFTESGMLFAGEYSLVFTFSSSQSNSAGFGSPYTSLNIVGFVREPGTTLLLGFGIALLSGTRDRRTA